MRRPWARAGTALLLSAGAALMTVAAAAVPAAPRATTPAPTVACTFTDPRLGDIAGLAASVLHPGILWASDGVKGGPHLYALSSTTCQVLAAVTLADATGRDLEAVATGRDAAGRAVVWVGDIGDSTSTASSVRVMQLAEPAVLRDETLPVRTWRFTYDDGAHDARTLLAAPRGARLWVVTKALGGAGLYALPALPAVPSGGTSSEVLVATKTAPVDGVITDGTVSPDGRHTVLRGYLTAHLYRSVPPGRTSQPVPLPTQLQGEAIAWSSDGRVLFTAGGHEGTLWRVPVPGITPVPAPTRSPSPSASAAPAPAPSGGSSSATVRRVLLGTGLALGAGALAFVASRRYRVG